jgi:hypothetical protein
MIDSHAVAYRQLPAEEWGKLHPIYAEQGANLPLVGANEILVAESNRKVIGMWAVNLLFHAGPSWVHPDWRNRGISTELGKGMDDIVRNFGGREYFNFPSNEASARVSEKLGFELTGWQVRRRKV